MFVTLSEMLLLPRSVIAYLNPSSSPYLQERKENTSWSCRPLPGVTVPYLKIKILLWLGRLRGTGWDGCRRSWEDLATGTMRMKFVFVILNKAQECINTVLSYQKLPLYSVSSAVLWYLSSYFFRLQTVGWELSTSSVVKKCPTYLGW